MRVLGWFLVMALFWEASPGYALEPTVAFFYGAHPPLEELRAFDLVVVEPGQGWHPKEWNTPHSELFAYVSVGEVETSRSYFQEIPEEWFLGENPRWGGKIVDQSRPLWPRFFVRRVIGPLWQKGYRGFFLDTLDSYRLVVRTPQARARQEEGLVGLIRLLKQSYPQARLILNRGFEILPRVHNLVFAVAAESLFWGWDPARKRYIEVGPSDRAWLLEQLQKVRQEYGLPVVVLDYVPPERRERAREVAKKIASLGFIPWVSNPELNMLGVGAIEVVPRKVLMLYDSREVWSLAYSDLHRYVDFPLSYLGYVTEYWDVRRPLPDYPLVGRFAGIVSWLHSEDYGPELHAWFLRQVAQGVPLVLLGRLGFPLEEEFLKPLHLTLTAPPPRRSSPLHITVQDRLVGFEIDPIPDRRRFLPLRLLEGKPLLQLKNQEGQLYDAVALTPWGGYALAPYLVMNLPPDGERHRWILNPLDFLARALSLPSLPVPDTTTENGRRLMLVHIDGDGFAHGAQWYGGPLACEVLLEEVLKKYRVPTTVSVIQGEVAPNGLYPDLSPRLEAVARQIFSLPHVEIASHSYSHPFFWQVLEGRVRPEVAGVEPGEPLNLEIPGYRFDPKVEVQGSIRYINQRLAPRGKQCRIFLWSGDCNPSARVVGEAYAAGVRNMNGGDTLITEDHPSLTAIAPLGLKKGPYFQVYAPNQNENVYTHNWTGPFYGFERVIETFRLTDLPHRFKPINIYYHTYAASKRASLQALKRVYRWALGQPIFPIYASEYVDKVLDFRRVVLARDGEGWRVRGVQHLHQLRAPQTLGYPDLERSRGVVGFCDHGDARYLHLRGGGEVRVRFRPTPPEGPYLVEANARLTHWQRREGEVRFGLKGYLPLTFRLAHKGQCQVWAQGQRLKGQEVKSHIYEYRLRHRAVRELRVTCG